MFWKQKYPIVGIRDNDGSERESISGGSHEVDEENLAQDYDVFSEKDVDESILSFLKSDEEEEVGGAALGVNGSNIDDGDVSYAPSSADRSRDNAHDPDTVFPDSDSTFSAWSNLLSNSLFLFGSTLYVWTSYYSYDYFQQYGAFPRDAGVREEVVDDDILDELFFQANAKSSSSYVTLYMAYSFAAALCFALQGFWNTCFAPQCRGRIHAILWALAAMWGMTSSALVLKDQYLSGIFASVRVHLFALAAFYSCCVPKPSTLRKAQCCLPRCCCCCNPGRWLRLADCILIFGTLGDTVLSYLYLWRNELENSAITPIHLLYGGMAAAGCWGLCAMMYIFISLGQVCGCCGSQQRKNQEEDADDQESKAYYIGGGNDDDDESQESNGPSYLPQDQKLKLQRGPTDDTANDDASVTSFSSWWTAGPATKDGIAPSSLDNIFGRMSSGRK